MSRLPVNCRNDQKEINNGASKSNAGITYGDGWIAKKRGTMTSTMYYSITGYELDDPFVQAFING